MSGTAAFEARFGGIQRLVGVAGADRLCQSQVCVVGIGGVGSWVVEALARSGVGALTLVDLDEVCISNTNRQLHATVGRYGRPKVDVMAERVQSINPEARVIADQRLFTPGTAAAILGTPYSVVVDAIDQPAHKCLLIARCRERGIPLVTVGGAGGRRDPTRIQIADLAQSSHDALLQEVRRRLRRDHGFPRGKERFGVESVFSTESPVYPTADGCVTSERGPDLDLRLDCASGYGTAAYVTGAFGLAAAAAAVRRIVEGGAA